MDNFKCKKQYQTSGLSHTKGGWDVEVKMTHQKKAIVYSNIHYPAAYAQSILNGEDGHMVEYIKKIGKSQ
tara:strand:+ start:425 stop:634 length:210 start_codon:yes stop_codon:yes gene_type:complete